MTPYSYIPTIFFSKKDQQFFKTLLFQLWPYEKKDECNLSILTLLYIVLKVHKSHLSINEALDIRTRSDQVQPSVLHESPVDKNVLKVRNVLLKYDFLLEGIVDKETESLDHHKKKTSNWKRLSLKNDFFLSF